jgi:hypothetical protein
MHSVKIHLASNDTGPAAVIDSLRAVVVSFTVTNGLTGTAERKRTISRLIRLPNAGLANKRTCGDQPFAVSALGASYLAPGAGGPAIKLTWTPSVDENAGEKDVERYVLWRKRPTDPDWGDPYLSIPAGSATYVYTDAQVTSGDQWYYAVAAEDCTPQFSTLMSSPLVNVP